MKMQTIVMKKLGEKAANLSISPRCWPWGGYQPQPPAKIAAQMKDEK